MSMISAAETLELFGQEQELMGMRCMHELRHLIRDLKLQLLNHNGLLNVQKQPPEVFLGKDC